jgi:hypothetical protein
MTTDAAPDRAGLAPQGVLAGPGSITVIAGLTFAISDERGDMGPGPFGLIADDTRHLSGLRVLVDSEPLRHLGSGLITPSVAHFRGYATLRDRRPDAPVECERVRELTPAGMVETLTVRCWTLDPVQLDLEIQLDADFADIVEVRRLGGDSGARSSGVPRSDAPDRVRFEVDGTARATTVRMDPPPELLDKATARWTVPLARARPWTVRLEVGRSGVPGPPSARRCGPGRRWLPTPTSWCTAGRNAWPGPPSVRWSTWTPSASRTTGTRRGGCWPPASRGSSRCSAGMC